MTATLKDRRYNECLYRNYSISDKSSRFWDAGNDALNVETTAYALLAQMAVGRLKLAGPIVTWLTNQRDPQGGFVSTQVRILFNVLKEILKPWLLADLTLSAIFDALCICISYSSCFF